MSGLSRLKVVGVLIIIWAGIYLPGLGEPELRGEEGRRVLPALHMMETGNWVQPYVGGVPYYSKPPGINWLIAGAFYITGEVSEYSARLVSVYSVLAMALLIVLLKTPWLDMSGKLIAAIIFMTNISLVEKGRLIEIEPVYIFLTGAAVLVWFNSLYKRPSGGGGGRWIMWLVPGALLGYGMLVKGPVILLVFYVIAIIVTVYLGRWRDFFSIEHLAGLLVMAVMFGGWFLAARAGTDSAEMVEQMSGQMSSRVLRMPNFKFWLTNIFKSFVNFLPWLLFVPAMWDRRLLSRMGEKELRFFRAVRLGVIVGFVLILLMPGMLPRYSLPVFGPLSIVLGWAISKHNELFSSDKAWQQVLVFLFGLVCVSAVGGLIFIKMSLGGLVTAAVSVAAGIYIIRNRKLLSTINRLAVCTGFLVVIAMLHYSAFGMEFVKSDDIHRPVAESINSMVPQREPVYIYRPGFQTFIFYIDRPVEYVQKGEQIRNDVRFLIIDYDKLMELKDEHISPRQFKILFEFESRLFKPYVLVELSGRKNQIIDSNMDFVMKSGQTPGVDS